MRIGAEVTVRVTVKSVERSRAVLETLCLVADVIVAQGEATVVPPRRRKGAAD